jgi:hypothetical protein
VAVLISLGIGALVLVPSLSWLYMLFQRGSGPGPQAEMAEPPTSPLPQ